MSPWMPQGHVVRGMSEEAPKRPMQPPIPLKQCSILFKVSNGRLVYHMFPSSKKKPLHEHVLSSHKGKSLLFHGRVFFYRSSWPPTDLSERLVHFAREVCHLVTFQWYAACLCIICSQTQTAVFFFCRCRARFFFYLDAAWLNEGRCPGGRPSVSKN